MLSRKAGEAEVRELFAPFGEIREIYMIRNADGTSKCAAFLRYVKRESAVQAIENLNHSVVMDGATRPLIVKFADTKAQRQARQLRNSRRDQLLAAMRAGPGYPGFQVRSVVVLVFLFFQRPSLKKVETHSPPTTIPDADSSSSGPYGCSTAIYNAGVQRWLSGGHVGDATSTPPSASPASLHVPTTSHGSCPPFSFPKSTGNACTQPAPERRSRRSQSLCLPFAPRPYRRRFGDCI